MDTPTVAQKPGSSSMSKLQEGPGNKATMPSDTCSDDSTSNKYSHCTMYYHNLDRIHLQYA